MRLVPRALASLALVFAACSDDVTPANDAIDAIDATPIDAIDAAGCGSDFFFTGEFVSWDSTTTTFMGVFEARWTVRGAPFRTILTNPNGRVELCLDPQATTSTIDVSKPGLVSGIFVAQPAVFQPPGTFFFSSKASFMFWYSDSLLKSVIWRRPWVPMEAFREQQTGEGRADGVGA